MIARPLDERHRQMAARASTFSDRLSGACVALDAPDSSSAEERVSRWRSVVAPYDAGLFDKRLSWDGWNPDTARSLVADVDVVQAPGWMATLHQVFGATPAEVAGRFADDPRADRVVIPGEAVAFEELYVPAVRHARERVRELLPEAYGLLTDEAHLNFERALFSRLSGICQRALYTAFTAHRVQAQGRGVTPLLFGTGGRAPDLLFRRFKDGCKAGWILDFFADHPVAARLCAVAVEQWVETTAEVIERTARDFHELQRAFGGSEPLGRVVQVRTDSGDTHDGGRAVAILTFENGTKVVYKPRSVELDAFWARVVAWFNAHRAGGLELRAAAPLEREGYGWLEFVPSGPCASEDEVRAYYERSGETLGIVYALNGNDYHAENILPSGEHPVLIDHEALMTPLGFKAPESASILETYADLLMRTLRGSVTATGLLPLMREMRDDRVVIELGGMTSGDSPELEVGLVHWRHLNTDLMRMATERLPYKAGANVPVLDGEPVFAAAYAEEVARGFETAYRTVLAGRDEVRDMLGAVARAPVRYITRNTSLYVGLLQRCLHPEFLRHGWRRAVELDVLARPFLAGNDRPVGWAMVSSEVRSLENNDVPLFYTYADSTALVLPDGSHIEGFFDDSALAQAYARLDLLCERDLARQAEAIRLAFVSAAARRLGTAMEAVPVDAAPAREWDASAALGEAEALGDLLESRAFHATGGLRAWQGIQYMVESGRYALQQLGPTLFDGSLGIALLDAALARLSGHPRHEERAAAISILLLDPTLFPAPNEEAIKAQAKKKDVGAGTGMAGTVYVLAAAARLLGRADFTESAVRYARLLAISGRYEENRLGAMNGLSGAVLGLLKTHREVGDAQSLDDAAELGARLLSLVRERHADALAGADAAVADLEGLPSGIPQGAAGIALALFRLNEARPDAEMVATAEALLAYDARRREAEDGFSSARPRVRTGWAEGDVCAAIARLAAPEGSAARAGLGEILERVAASVAEGTDELANGAMGRIDLLLTAGLALGDEGMVERARAAAMQVLARKAAFGGWQTGWGPRVCHEGAFQGVSGIGYALARLCAPELLPSLLDWS